MASKKLFSLLWLCALLLVGSYLRVHGVSEYYYNPDELSNIAIAKGATVSDVIAYSRFETHPPYPAILRHFLIQISDSPEVLRGESVFFGLLCILVYYGIGKNAGGTLAGCIAAFLVTFSYGNILQSQVVRNYTLLAFFLGCTYWCYQRFIAASHKQKYAIAYTIFGLLSLMTNYSAIFMCFSVYVVSAFFMLRDKQWHTLRLWTLANLVLAAYFGYQYVTEIQHNAYEDFWATNNAVMHHVASYNTLSFRSLVFAKYISATISYFLYQSYIASANFLVIGAFLASVIALFFLKRRLVCEVMIAFMLGALLTALNMYPYTFNLGNRYAIWILPYVILPLTIALVRIIPLPTSWRTVAALIGMLGGIMLYPKDLLLADFREHPLAEAEEKTLEQFMDGLGAHDLIIAGGLGSIGVLADSTHYYASLKNNSHTNWYFTDHRGNTPIVYTQFYPPLLHGQILYSADMLKEYAKAGVLDNITTVWVLDSGWSKRWDGFIECMVNSGNAIIRPELDKEALGEVGYATQAKFIGISADTLRNHTYSCE